MLAVRELTGNMAVEVALDGLSSPGSALVPGNGSIIEPKRCWDVTG